MSEFLFTIFLEFFLNTINTVFNINIYLSHHFDQYEFMSSHTLNQDLSNLGVQEAEHRNKGHIQLLTFTLLKISSLQLQRPGTGENVLERWIWLNLKNLFSRANRFSRKGLDPTSSLYARASHLWNQSMLVENTKKKKKKKKKNPESLKKQNLNRPHASNFLHRIYIAFTTIYITFTLQQV